MEISNYKGNNDIDFARFCFDNKHYDKAKDIFLNRNMLYEAAFCALLTGNAKGARLILDEIKTPSSASEWGLIICDVVEKKPLHRQPKYFQVRAFLEIYINLFLENELWDFADNVINSYKYFTRVNSEVPKFIARVLSVWGYFDLVHEFCALAKKICYYDPEVHYIEAETYFVEDKYKMAQDAIEEAVKVAPEYFPAQRLKRIIENLRFN